MPDSLQVGHPYNWLPPVFETALDSSNDEESWLPWPDPTSDNWDIEYTTETHHDILVASPLSMTTQLTDQVPDLSITSSIADIGESQAEAKIDDSTQQEIDDILNEYRHLFKGDRFDPTQYFKYHNFTITSSGKHPDEVFNTRIMYDAISIILK